MERLLGDMEINGNSLEYSIVGEGEPVLVMHGGHSNCYEEFGYDFLIKRGYSIITPSRPGYGNTSKEIGENLQTACEHYIKLLNHLHIDKVHVIAISAGGPSGIYFATLYPEYVKTLTLQSAVTKEWLTPKDVEYKAGKLLFHPNIEKATWSLISTISNLFPFMTFKLMFPSFSTLKHAEARGEIDTNDVEAIRRMNNRQRSGHGFFIDLEQVDEITTEDLQSISSPTLIMQSKNDSSVSVEHATHAYENIPTSELCMLEAWGHLIWLGKSSNETNTNLINFLIKHKIS
ncbi:alpha/beta fold hydrolase [Virgibacillus kekensis]|uniref:Alpha/beta fold hydrolase n=1 Tax=Virgibacillus kekensis TaxID=202261 RepID=A0ABV9DMY1_9BACI